MEEYQIRYLRENKSKLLDGFTWGVALKTHLHSTYVLESHELDDLEDITSRRERIWRLIEKLIGKTGGYQILIEAADKSNQTGARDLLKRIPNPNPSTTSQVVQDQEIEFQNPLHFDENTDLLNTVISKVRADFITSWTQNRTNTQMIIELAALNVFDYAELSDLVTGQGQYAVESTRMLALFNAMAALSRPDILKCLNCLCNMSSLPNLSARNLAVFRKHFPNAIKHDNSRV